MATVTKDFRVKNGIIVEGANGTIDNKRILREDDSSDYLVEGQDNLFFTDDRAKDAAAQMLLNATKQNIDFTYDAENNQLTITAENGVADSTTDDLDEGTTNLYFTPERAVAAVGGSATSDNVPNTIVKRDQNGDFEANGITVSAITLGTADLQTTLEDIVTDAEDYADGAVLTHNNLTSGVHGVTGNVVGTSDEQLLTNKTFGDDILMDGNQLSGLGTPTQPDHAATKAYVDSVAEGLHVHASVVAATTENIDLATGGLLIIDEVQLVAGNRVLVKNQTLPAENGIYIAAVGAWTRSEDYNTAGEIDAGDFVFVSGGTLYNNTGWVQENNVTTLGSDPILWDQFSGAGTYLAGNGLLIDGNTFEIDETITATRLWTLEQTEAVDLAAQGYADTAEANAKQYTDEEIGLLTTTDIEEGTRLYFTDQRAVDAIQAVTPVFEEIDINSVALQVAATTLAPTAGQVVAYAFDTANYRSGEFLVKVAYGTHTEVSRIVVTLDSSDNIAITEYAIVGTNGSLSSISADVATGNARILVTTANDSSRVTVVGTLLI